MGKKSRQAGRRRMDQFRKPPEEPMPELSGMETLVRGSIEGQAAMNIRKVVFAGETKDGFVPCFVAGG